ncbi:crossover junction endodeoxyribonuclease RuvC [Candidatus Pacearchaeota archaeon]|nr:crossover junction endodeoxyribonuclease RuvC [Candidatus Pacearchaeota archaeon]
MAIILGIDPGLATVGFGVIESNKGKLKYLDCGVIKTAANLELPERLNIIKYDMVKLIESIKPDAIGVEELFFAKNVTNAIKVAQARGVIVQTASDFKIPIYEFTPLQIKNNVAGHGTADKWQIQEMVKRMLNLTRHPKPDDAADGLAIAICTERVASASVSLKKTLQKH